MREERHTQNLRQGAFRALPWLVLLVMLSVTWFASNHEHQVNRQATKTQFDFALRETVSRIEQRVQGYEQMLRGVQSLYATTPWLNRAALRDYVEGLQLDANFVGIQAIGVVDWVPEEAAAKHLNALRASGFPGYQIAPAGARAAYAPIVQREPYIGRNRAAIGTDVWIDPTRRNALEKSRDSGMPAISGKVELKVDVSSEAPPGFIMYLPIYARESAHGNLQSRRAHLKGWVYASFHMSDFMASLYGTQQPGLSLAIYDGTELTPGTLMYRSATTTAGGGGNGSLHAREYMVVGGRNWTLSLNSLDGFDYLYGRSLASEIGVAGVVLSVVLAFLAWLLIHGRARALRIAERMTEELRHMAQHDTLTGLPNRALFSDRLNQELEHARRHKGRFAMLFIDLDNFKPINDQYGHAIGDDVLIKAAQRLKSCVRAADSVGRIGGDEFVVLLAQLNETEPVQALAEKMHRSLKNPMVVNGQEFSISSSIGVAVFPQDGADAEALTKSADEAMYRAKKAGRDCVRLSEANGDHHV